MEIGGVVWWRLLGMFGFGAALGFLVSYLFTQKLAKPVSADFWGGCWGVLAAVGLTLIAMPLAGIAAVGLAFVMHHAGWDQPMLFLVVIGLAFLVLVVGWIVRQSLKKPN